MVNDRLGDLLADGHVRSQRRHRILEDHRQLHATKLIELSDAATDQRFGAEPCLTADTCVGGQQTHHREKRLTLAGARLAHDAHALAAPDLEREVVDRRQRPIRRVEHDGELFDVERHRRFVLTHDPCLSVARVERIAQAIAEKVEARE